MLFRSCLLQVAIPASLALDNGVGITPPLGWSSWNLLTGDINETIIKGVADGMVSSGLSKLGYRYINVDAGYLIPDRDEQGRLQSNKTLFPSGMRALSDYIHERGLQFGLYTDLGDSSCGPSPGQKGPGSFGHYEIDAETFANEWRIDYLKVDFCGFGKDSVPLDNTTAQYIAWRAFGDALNKTGRPIYYSICPHGKLPKDGTALADASRSFGGHSYSPPLDWTREMRSEVANSLLVEWTNLFDFWYAEHWGDFRGMKSSTPGGLITNVDSMVYLTNFSYSGPGSWNDADMLDVCNYGRGGDDAGGRKDGGMTLAEYRASLSLWSVFASPLIISADLSKIQTDHPECLELLLNAEVLAVNQAQGPGVSQSRLISQFDNATAYTGGIVNSSSITSQVFARAVGVAEDGAGTHAVVLFNRMESDLEMNVTWASLGIGPRARVRDLWAAADLGVFAGGYATVVSPHSVAMIRVESVGSQKVV